MKRAIIVFLMMTTAIAVSQKTIQPTVSVTGEGIIKTVPDEVTITVQVENKGTEPKALKKKNDKTIDAILSFLKGMKVDKKDIITQYVRLQKTYDYQTKTYSFIANQSVLIKLKDLSKYETVMSGLLANGINRIDGINFSSSKDKELKMQSRKLAMQNAKIKAEEYAGVLNQTIGKAITISEFSSYNQPPVMYTEASVRMVNDSNSSEQTLSVGILEIRSTINVVFELN